jgi:hypothetical protein
MRMRELRSRIRRSSKGGFADTTKKIPHTGGGFQFVVRLFIAAAESG